jgi:hypothetical protein
VYEEDWSNRVARGESLEEIWRHAIGMRPTVVEKHGGEDVVTATHLMQFRDGLLHAAQSVQCRVVNATGAGILRGGRVEQGRLPTLLGNARRLPALTLPRRTPASSVVASLRAAARELAQTTSLPQEWASIFDEHLPPDSSLFEQLIAIRASLREWADEAE